jgi:phosphohistidine phosphatase
MKLYLMRHGEASDEATNDELRPLTQTGRERLANAGKVLKKIIELDAVYASPRLRAQQTAEVIANVFGQTVTIREELNFSFSVEALKSLLIDVGHGEEARLLLVGHNPSISEVIHQMTGANVNLKTGAFACLEVSPIALKGATLKWLLTPRRMDEWA